MCLQSILCTGITSILHNAGPPPGPGYSDITQTSACALYFYEFIDKYTFFNFKQPVPHFTSSM